MSYSYASIDEVWKNPPSMSQRKRRHQDREPSPSPSQSVISSNNETIIISGENDSNFKSYKPRNVIISRSPSQSSSYTSSMTSEPMTGEMSQYSDSETDSIVYSGRGSPVASLDIDDYDPKNVYEKETTVQFVNSLPGNPRDTQNTTKTMVDDKQTINKLNDKKMLRHILRIQDDVREMLRKNTQSNDSSPSFPIVETGLFLAVGLFVLLAMNMMLKMGKQHITYRFNVGD